MKLPVAVAVIASSSIVESSSWSWQRAKGTTSIADSVKTFRHKRIGGPGRLPSSRKPENGTARECVLLPATNHIYKEYYDVGILDCEPHEYCAESDTSSLGGVCVDNAAPPRGLQEYYTQSFLDASNCDPQGSSYYDCDCSEFDFASNTGSFTCTIYKDYCFEDGICGDFTVQNTITSDETTTDYCYSFKEPFEIEFCYRFHKGKSCNVIVDKETCNSCEIVDVNNAELGYTSFNCLSFDCTNTFARQAGNDCLGSYLLDAVFPLGKDSTAPPSPVSEENVSTVLPETSHPSALPSQQPSVSQTDAPTSIIISPEPSSVGAASAIESLTSRPTRLPTQRPTSFPSSTPSAVPSARPSQIPTDSPTIRPTISPSGLPTADPPTNFPSHLPTAAPSNDTSVPAGSRSDITFIPSSELPNIPPPTLVDAPPLDPSIRFPSMGTVSSSTSDSVVPHNLELLLLLSLVIQLVW
jgi:hypothetical protein